MWRHEICGRILNACVNLWEWCGSVLPLVGHGMPRFGPVVAAIQFSMGGWGMGIWGNEIAVVGVIRRKHIYIQTSHTRPSILSTCC